MEALSAALAQFLEILARVGPLELVDVIVVAFILYQALRLVRGTQATQLIVGLVVLAILGLVATQFHLILLGWLFQNAAPVLVITIVVLFQPELRRMLDVVGRRIGNLPRLTTYSSQQFNRSIAESIRSAERFSARRTGALIAFERDTGLADYASTGVRLNAELSAEVLQTIFFPNSPLHDGAVIVRGNTILAAGCLLPLADESVIHERLGTRHRAAIGLSLASDALLLVVSEETGGISVVENGNITRNLDADGLRARLTGSLQRSQPEGSGRPNLPNWRFLQTRFYR
ncbi:MAG: diadenylate cyclase CdaA [Candidatus Dormibacteraeota bacterium]|uniref:diadenylate cyclase CdaA n=1 Tax=Candidatus Dormibacter sp. TaxID=2973982 RepID=UPI000DAF7429|nr:diadenylate cyclase CdaA [Candidatus Dormibacteraeota bacterium]PZR70241.1 MAG: TIGR00159 family protein [Candidatus Dormibacteraeota bacterium]